MKELTELKDRLYQSLHEHGREGHTLECDMLHGRIGEIENVQAMLLGEDETLEALLKKASE